MRKILLLFFIALFTREVTAQWEFTGGPYGGRLHGVAQDSSGNLYAFKDMLGWSFYKSTDNGETWFDNGSHLNLNGREMLCHPNGMFFLKNNTDVFRSVNGGETWNELNLGVSVYLQDMVIHPNGNLLLIAGGNQLLTSDDFGDTWTATSLDPYRASYLTVDPSGLLYSTAYYVGYLLVSADGGLSWDSIPKNPAVVLDLKADINGRLEIIEEQQVIRSADGGYTWQQIYNGPASAVLTLPGGIVLIAANDGAVYRSDDDGLSWQTVKTSAYFTGFYPLRDDKIAAISDRGFYISHDMGQNWQLSCTGILEAELFMTAASDSGTILAVTNGISNILWRYNEMDQTWVHIMDDLPEYTRVLYNGGHFWLLEQNRVRRSSDGVEWTQLPFPGGTELNNVSCTNNGTCIFPTLNDIIYVTDNFGDSLLPVEDNLPSEVFMGEAFHLSEDTVLLITGKHAYKMPDVRSVEIYMSTDSGHSWIKISELDVDEYVAWDAMMVQDANGNLYIGNPYYNELHGSSDKGYTWQKMYPVGELRSVFTANDEYLYANVDFRRIERTKNFGATWELYMDGLHPYPSLPFWSGAGSQSGYAYVHLRDVYYKAPNAEGATTEEQIVMGVYRRNTSVDVTTAVSHKKTNIKVYPNPANVSITIDYPDFKPGEAKTIQMFDISGRIIKEMRLNSVQTVIDITDLAPGTYLLKGASMQGVFTKANLE